MMRQTQQMQQMQQMPGHQGRSGAGGGMGGGRGRADREGLLSKRQVAAQGILLRSFRQCETVRGLDSYTHKR
jgi:hypothetical protein